MPAACSPRAVPPTNTTLSNTNKLPHAFNPLYTNINNNININNNEKYNCSLSFILSFVFVTVTCNLRSVTVTVTVTVLPAFPVNIRSFHIYIYIHTLASIPSIWNYIQEALIKVSFGRHNDHSPIQKWNCQQHNKDLWFTSSLRTNACQLPLPTLTAQWQKETNNSHTSCFRCHYQRSVPTFSLSLFESKTQITSVFERAIEVDIIQWIYLFTSDL